MMFGGRQNLLITIARYIWPANAINMDSNSGASETEKCALGNCSVRGGSRSYSGVFPGPILLQLDVFPGCVACRSDSVKIVLSWIFFHKYVS